MRPYRVALDRGIHMYEPILTAEGYEVVSLPEANLTQVDAVLLSGGNDDAMGITEPATEAFTVNVDGRRPEEVLESLRQRLRLKEGGF